MGWFPQTVALCTIAGCSFSAHLGGADGDATAFTPSHLDDTQDLVGVTGVLDVTGSWLIDTGPTQGGTIRTTDSAMTLRAAGEGIDATLGLRFRIISPTLAVLGVDRLAIRPGTTLVAVGSRALIILVRHDARIAGTLDLVGGHGSLDLPGAGGGRGGALNRAAVGCGAGGEGGGDSGINNEGGGGGGGFGTMGARGGDATEPSGPKPGGVAGVACGDAQLTMLIGGSGGGHAGGTETANGGGGDGGGGGGAVQISALAQIAVASTGVIDAGGGGGGPTRDNDAGGGGGGAGGAILLEAPQLVLDTGAIIVANGGGGGAGRNAGQGNLIGGPGTRSTEPAPGGTGFQSASGGGGGGATAEPTPGQSALDGGGGGGGSIGRVRFHATTFTSSSPLVSPPQTTGPLPR